VVRGAAAATTLLLALWGCGDGAAPDGGAASVPATGPSWAPGMSTEQSRAFLAAVLEHFASEGTVVRVEDGWIVPEGDDAAVRYGLTNVAQACVAAPEEQWPAVIAEHFQALRSSQGDLEGWLAKMKDWDTARRHLRLRVHHRDLELPAELGALQRVDLPGTTTVVSLDLPVSVVTPGAKDLQAWGKSAEEVWAAALANERAASMPAPEELSVGAGSALLAFEADHFFVASIALRPDQLPGEPPPHGWLLAVPTRNFALAYPVTGLGVMQAVTKLGQVVPKSSAAGPGSVSRHLYWWDGTTYHCIRTTGEGANASVELGDAFTGLLNRLASGK
jgi:hypothetical protein